MDEFDIIAWPLELSRAALLSQHNVAFSKVISVNSFQIGQILRKPNKLNKSDLSLFLIENIGLLVIILVGFVLSVIAKCAILKLNKRRFSSLYNLLVINRTRSGSISFKIGVLSMALYIFLFFDLRILTNMIKTDKVTVSTSEFIDSISKLNRTSKTMVAWDTNSTILFYQIFKKRKQNDVIAFDAKLRGFFDSSKCGLDYYFYFMCEFFFFFTVYHVTLVNRSVDHFIFFQPTIYFESLKAIFYRKDLDDKMKRILNRR